MIHDARMVLVLVSEKGIGEVKAGEEGGVRGCFAWREERPYAPRGGLGSSKEGGLYVKID